MATAPGPARRKVSIDTLTIHDVTFDQTVAAITEWAAERSGGYVCTPNVDYVVRARRDPSFRNAIGGARLRAPDGMWIVYASRIAGRPLSTTVTGRLLLPAVADAAAVPGRQLRIALFGAGPGIARRAAAVLHESRPGLQIATTISPPNPLVVGSMDDERLVATLTATRPDVIFVALGAPKQEIWMQRHADAMDGAVLVGVGAAFDIVAGRFREAPKWMTRSGLEWLMRLAHEPRRLGRRYLLDDPWILWWAFKTRLARPKHSSTTAEDIDLGA